MKKKTFIAMFMCLSLSVLAQKNYKTQLSILDNKTQSLTRTSQVPTLFIDKGQSTVVINGDSIQTFKVGEQVCSYFNYIVYDGKNDNGEEIRIELYKEGTIYKSVKIIKREIEYIYFIK